MGSSLTEEQLDHIRRHPSRAPRALARELAVDVRRIEAALASIGTGPAEDRGERLVRWLAPLLVVVAGIVAYSGNLDCGWHFDDQHAILQNRAIHEPTIGGIARYNLYRQVLYWTFAASWNLHGASPAGWHLENDAIHVVNGLLVYALALVTFRALRHRAAVARRDGTPGVASAPRWPYLCAAFAAALFVAHPLQTQAVTYITQRTESLCATFCFLALLLFARARVERLEGRLGGARPWLVVLPFAAGILAALLCALGATFAAAIRPSFVVPLLGSGAALGFGLAAGGAWVLVRRGDVDRREALLLAGTAASTLLAMATKEVAGALPLIAIAWELLFARGAGAPEITVHGGLRSPPCPGPAGHGGLVAARVARAAYMLPWIAIIVGLTPLAVRIGLTVRLFADAEASVEPGAPRDAFDYARTELDVLATYVRLLLLPYGQSIDWRYPRADSLLAGPTPFSLVALAGLVAAGALAWRRAPVLALGVTIWLAVLAPTSSFFVLPDYLFEHRCYMALAGPALVAAVLLERLVRRLPKGSSPRAVYAGVATATVVALALAARARNEVWADEETLWQDAIAKTGRAKPRPFVNLGLHYQGLEPEELLTDGGDVLRGEILEGGGDTLIVRPTLMTGPVEGIALPRRRVVARRRLGGLARAEEAYKQALAIEPLYYKAKNNLALCEVQLGVRSHFDADGAARGAAEAARGGAPRAVVEQLARSRDTLRRTSDAHFAGAEGYFQQMLQQRPEDAVAHNNLGNLYLAYFGDDRLPDAERELRATIRLRDEASVHAVLGEVLYKQAKIATDPAARTARLAEAEREYVAFLSAEGTGPYAEHIRKRLKRTSEALKHGGALPEDEGPAIPGAGGALQGVFPRRAG